MELCVEVLIGGMGIRELDLGFEDEVGICWLRENLVRSNCAD